VSEFVPSGAIAVVVQQISNFHVARLKAAAGAFEQLTIVSSMNDADFREFLSDAPKELNINRLFDGRKAYMDAVRNGQIWDATHEALDKLAPSVVAVSGWSFPESVSAISWAKDNGARLVMMSASQLHDSPRHKMRELLKSRIVSSCDAALVGGRSQANYITRLGMPRERVSYGYNAVEVDNDHFANGADLARVNAAAERARLGLPKQYLLASGRFIPKKNLVALVRAFSIAFATSRGPNHLVILGDGPGRLKLQQTIVDAGLSERVLLADFKCYADLPVCYGLAQTFVHVSLSEQWGLVINEAAAAGLPLIVSRFCGAASELVEPGVNGILVEPTDVDDMARALQQMMSATDEMRSQMGRESRRIVASWAPDRFVAGLMTAVNSGVRKRRKRLVPWDRLLLRALASTYHSAVE